MFLHTIKQTLHSQSGRSMVEMLGTLAITGVLTITSIFGISYLFNKRSANQIMEDARLAYISAPTNVCKNKFEAVEFYPDSGKPIHRYCDPKEELYIRVSNISDDVCALILDLEQEGEFQLYTYDEYTRPTCDKEDNALIFAFGDIGFPAISCEDITDCPDGFYGVCDSDGKVCLECSLTQMPNETQDKCLEVACDEETETLCDNGEAKWCCPNTEICSTIAGECIKSDGMCSAIFSEPKVTKTYDCAYKFNEPVVTKTYDCAYKMVSATHEEGFETVDFVEVKPCANSSLYCNLKYADETCATVAPDGTPSGQIIYGSCSEMSRADMHCMASVDDTNVLEEVKPCANSSLYCNLKYADETCATVAPDGTTSGHIIYGSCSEMNRADMHCMASVDDTHVLQEVKTCPAKQYCYLKYANEQCAVASDSAQDLLFGVCLDMNSGNAVCPAPKN